MKDQDFAWNVGPKRHLYFYRNKKNYSISFIENDSLELPTGLSVSDFIAENSAGVALPPSYPTVAASVKLYSMYNLDKPVPMIIVRKDELGTFKKNGWKEWRCVAKVYKNLFNDSIAVCRYVNRDTGEIASNFRKDRLVKAFGGDWEETTLGYAKKTWNGDYGCSTM